VYRIGFTTQDVDIEIAKWRMNELIEKILQDTEATSYQLYLTASGDVTAFRKHIYPEYKANRKAPRPVHYEALREFLVSEWKAEVCTTIEADDAMSIAQCNTEYEGNGFNQTDSTIICSIDKDLDMVPGKHYNFVKETLYNITPWQGLYNFYMQCLTGDTADNIKGIEGIGPKKAAKLLENCTEEEELFDAVRNAYGNDYEFYINAECLWMLRKPYPYGKFSWTTLGLQLGQGGNSMPELVLNQAMPYTESIMEEMLRDGLPASGTFQRVTIEQTSGDQT
jgi:5'-3' exonuclease